MNGPGTRIKLLAIAVVLWAAAAAAWTLDVADSVSVVAGNVRVADLVRGEVPAEVGQVVIIPGVRPGFSGTVGARTILRRLVLANLAGGLTLAGAEACHITAAGMAVSGDALTERVRALLLPHLPPDHPDAPPGWIELDAASIEVTTAGPWRVGWPDAGTLSPGRNLITLELETEQGRRRFSVAATVHTYARTPQAVSTLTRGQDVDPAALGWVWTDLAQTDPDVVTDPAAMTGMMLARELGPGAAVTERDLAPRPLVQRGEMVDLLVQRGRVEAVVRAECRQDGHQGQLVSVLNPLTKRPVLASVVGPGVVTLGR